MGVFMGRLKEEFTPIEMNLVAGKGSDLNGNLIEPSSFEISMNEIADEEDVWATVGDASSDNPVSNSEGILDLLVENCYKGKQRSDFPAIS